MLLAMMVTAVVLGVTVLFAAAGWLIDRSLRGPAANPPVANPSVANPSVANPSVANPSVANPSVANPEEKRY